MSTKQDGPRSSVLLRRLIDNAPRCGGENDTDQRRNDPRWHGYFLEVERRKSDYLHVVGKAISCDCATAAARREAVAAAAQAAAQLRGIPAIDLMSESGMPFDWRLRRRVEQRREQSLWTVELAEPWWEEVEGEGAPPFDLSRWPVPTLGEARALLRRAGARGGDDDEVAQGGNGRRPPPEGGVQEMLLRMKDIRSQLSEVDAWQRQPRRRQQHKPTASSSSDGRRPRMSSSPRSSSSSSSPSPPPTPVHRIARHHRASSSSSDRSPAPSSSSSASSRSPTPPRSRSPPASPCPSPATPRTCHFRPLRRSPSPPSTPTAGAADASASAAPTPSGLARPRRSPVLESSRCSSATSSSSCESRPERREEEGAAVGGGGCDGGCKHHHLDGELHMLRRALSEKEQALSEKEKIIRELQHKLVSGEAAGGGAMAIDPSTSLQEAEATMQAHLADLQAGKEEALPLYEKWLNYYIGHKDYVDPRVVHLRDEVGANEAALRAMRSFVPANIWRMDKRQLAASGLAPQLVDRIWTNRALWLIRATRQRWLKGIDVKLLKRTGPGSFDISSLDHVEVRAIYLSIPSDLGPDNGGYRRAYRESVLERAYGDAKCPEAQRPRSKKRHALYVEAGERGPFDPDAPNEEFEAEVVGLGADKSVEEIKAERAAELERIRQAKARDRGEQVPPTGGGSVTPRTTSSSSGPRQPPPSPASSSPAPSTPKKHHHHPPTPPPSGASHLEMLRGGRAMLRKSPGPNKASEPLPPPPSPHLELIMQGRANLRKVSLGPRPEDATAAEPHPGRRDPPKPPPAVMHLSQLKQGMANLRKTRAGGEGAESAQDNEG